jgi:hypothetical protein
MPMWARGVTLLVTGALWLCGQDAAEPEWAGILRNARAHQISILNHLPNYTCIETVERSRRSNATHAFKLIDTLRLEVAMVDGKEMYGWPGSKTFESVPLRDLVSGDGAIANGDFGLHARAIFAGTATFDYRGTGSEGSRDQPGALREWMRFGYKIAVKPSGFTVRSGDKSAEVPYYGSFDVDPKTLDVQKIEVVADQIPAEIGIKKTADSLEYTHVDIGGTQFLLPLQSDLIMTDANGNESRNHVRFSSCRQFSGDSVLTFDDPTPTPEAPKPAEEIDLPNGVEMLLVLADEVDLQKAAVGDPVHARLRNDAKSKGRVWIPKNALASGRITRIERHGDSTMVGLTFDEVQSPAVHARLHLRLEQVALSDHLNPRSNYLLKPAAPGEGIVPLVAGHTRLNRGLLMIWSTEP